MSPIDIEDPPKFNKVRPSHLQKKFRPRIILVTQNTSIVVLFIDCRESHLHTLCRQIQRGGGFGLPY